MCDWLFYRVFVPLFVVLVESCFVIGEGNVIGVDELSEVLDGLFFDLDLLDRVGGEFFVGSHNEKANFF